MIFVVATDARQAIVFRLSENDGHGAPQGKLPVKSLGSMPEVRRYVESVVHEDGGTERLVLDLGMEPLVPPRINRLLSRSRNCGFQSISPIGICTRPNPTPKMQVLRYGFEIGTKDR